MNKDYLKKLEKLNQGLIKRNKPSSISYDDMYKKIIELSEMYLEKTIKDEYTLNAQTLLSKGS